MNDKRIIVKILKEIPLERTSKVGALPLRKGSIYAAILEDEKVGVDFPIGRVYLSYDEYETISSPGMSNAEKMKLLWSNLRS